MPCYNTYAFTAGYLLQLVVAEPPSALMKLQQSRVRLGNFVLRAAERKQASLCIAGQSGQDRQAAVDQRIYLSIYLSL